MLIEAYSDHLGLSWFLSRYDEKHIAENMAFDSLVGQPPLYDRNIVFRIVVQNTRVFSIQSQQRFTFFLVFQGFIVSLTNFLVTVYGFGYMWVIGVRFESFFEVVAQQQFVFQRALKWFAPKVLESIGGYLCLYCPDLFTLEQSYQSSQSTLVWPKEFRVNL